MHERRVALIIPTAGRPDDLARCLQSVGRDADERLHEVIVVDDAPQRPARVPPALGSAIVRVLRNPRPVGAAASRNSAIARLDAAVDVVGFIDDDVRLERGWWATALRALGPESAAITGPVQRFDDGVVARARQLRYDRRYAGLADGQSVAFMAGGNALIWRWALVRAGGFPEIATMSDRALACRLEELGMPCRFVSQLRVRHRHSKGARAAVREAWRAGRAQPPDDDIRATCRIARAVVALPRAVDPAAELLNVALDTVFAAGGLAAGRSPYAAPAIRAREEAASTLPSRSAESPACS